MGNNHQLVPLDGVRQTPVETRSHRCVVFAELRNNRLLALLHNEKTSAQPDQYSNPGNQASTDTSAFHVRLKPTTRPVATTPTAAIVIAAASVFVAAEKACQFFVEITPEFIQIGRALVSALRFGPCRWRRWRWPFRLDAGLLVITGRFVWRWTVTITTPTVIVQVKHA